MKILVVCLSQPVAHKHILENRCPGLVEYTFFGGYPPSHYYDVIIAAEPDKMLGARFGIEYRQWFSAVIQPLIRPGMNQMVWLDATQPI